MSKSYLYEQLNQFPRTSFLALLGFITGLVATYSLGISSPFFAFILLIVASVILMIPVKALQVIRFAALVFFVFFTIASVQQSLSTKKYNEALRVRDQLITSDLPIAQIKGTLAQAPRSPLSQSSIWLGEDTKISISGETYSVPTQIMVTTYELDDTRFHLGDEVEFIAEVLPVADTFGNRDWEKYLGSRNIAVRLNAKQLLNKTESNNPFYKLVKYIG